MIFETSWDDGGKHDIRLAELLLKYNMPGIFYIPTCSPLKGSQIKFLAEHLSIGGHTVTHPHDLKKLPGDLCYWELNFNKEFLQDLTGKRVDLFAYPRGRYNEQVIEVAKSCGFTQGRTTVVGVTERPENQFRYHTTVHVHPLRPEYKCKSWLVYAKEMFEQAKVNGYFHLWGHSYELEKYRLWHELEDFLKYVYDYQRSENNIDTAS